MKIWDSVSYFTRDMFACPCCGQCEMDPDFIEKLDKAREIADMPFIITSGFRCAGHNADVGGRENSRHLHGCAADIAIDNQIHRGRVLQALYLAGFTSAALAEGFTHVDDSENTWLGIYW